MTTDPRWTDEQLRPVAEIIARAVWPAGDNGRTPTDAPETAAAALAAAGLLLHPRGETREEWTVETKDRTGTPRTWLGVMYTEDHANRTAEAIRAVDGYARTMTRTAHLGPWQPSEGDR